jgi:AraC-like DNA-binding protein
MDPVISDYVSETVVYDHKRFASPVASDFPLHRHGMAELLLFVKGDASYAVEGKRYPLKAGDLVYVPASFLHGLCLQSDSEYERYDVLFSEELIPTELRDALSGQVVSRKSIPSAEHVFSRLDTFTSSLSRGVLETLFPSLVCELICELSLAGKRREAYGSDTLERVIEYIDRELITLTSLNTVCEELYLTKSALHALFRKHLGTTPKKYVTERRLYLAKSALRSGAAPTDVFRKCGFVDYATFFRNYKAFFGYPPSLEAEKEPYNTILS